MQAYSQEKINLKYDNILSPGIKSVKLYNSVFPDSLKKKLVTKKSISAIFLSIGTGISLPLDSFKVTASPTFGIMGRLEFASTAIFPFVIGGQVDYFSYNAPDEFKTVNFILSYKTKILGIGLNLEYSLAKLLRSAFTMPFLTVDVKSNMIKREYDDDKSYSNLPREESKISVGAGFGMTVFIFDFLANYMKDNSFLGVYAKTKIPVIKF